MLKETRQKEILEYIYKKEGADIKTLCKIFNVSHDTIQRDLIQLENSGEIKRVFGGAVPHQRKFPDYSQRVHDQKNEKKQIAKKAVSLLKNDQLIFIDGGTTNTLFASMIPHHISLTVVTNSFLVAMELRHHKNVKTILLGGDFMPLPMITGGNVACEQILDFHADLFFLGVDSLDISYGVSVPYYEEIGIKKAMIRQSEKVVCLCTEEKLNRKSKYRICSIEKIYKIVSADWVSQETIEKYGENTFF